MKKGSSPSGLVPGVVEDFKIGDWGRAKGQQDGPAGGSGARREACVNITMRLSRQKGLPRACTHQPLCGPILVENRKTSNR